MTEADRFLNNRKKSIPPNTGPIEEPMHVNASQPETSPKTSATPQVKPIASTTPPPLTFFRGTQRAVTLKEAWTRYWTRWTFAGRASRSEFTWPYMFNVVLMFVFLGLGAVCPPIIAIYLIYFALTLIPGLCVMIRRLHDVGLSGYYAWMFFFPLGGPFLLVSECDKPSEPRENKYGPVPNVE